MCCDCCLRPTTKGMESLFLHIQLNYITGMLVPTMKALVQTPRPLMSPPHCPVLSEVECWWRSTKSTVIASGAFQVSDYRGHTSPEFRTGGCFILSAGNESRISWCAWRFSSPRGQLWALGEVIEVNDRSHMREWSGSSLLWPGQTGSWGGGGLGSCLVCVA